MARRAGRPLAPARAFWDASALVPLCVRQSVTPNLESLYESYQAVVWWATPVEIASALAQLVRVREISSVDWVKARQVAAALAGEWSVIEPSNMLRAHAAQLVDRYELKAADALQLAAALDWCEGAPQGQIFIAADQRLREVAVLSGFDAKVI
jgi:predicted nucleic acid-binding protein